MSISIGPKGIELLLLQVDPGSEKRIASSLELQDPTKHHAHQVAKCFGKYDIIAIRRLDRNAHGLNLIEHRLLDKVLAVQQVLGFTWDTENSRTVVENLAAPEDWVGVALVKLSHEVLYANASAPIVNQFERGVIPIEKALQEQRNLSSFLVTGTVGWFDLAVFMWGKDLRAIANSVVALRALSGNQPGRSKSPLLDFTWTAFGIDYSFVHGRRNWKTLQSPAKTRVELGIRCRSSQPADLFRTLKGGEYFKTTDVGICFGDHDIYVRPTLQVQEYLPELIRLREHYGTEAGELFATSTNFLFEEEETPIAGLQVAGAELHAELEILRAHRENIGLVPFAEPAPHETSMRAIFDQEKRFSQLFASKLSSSLQWESYIDMLSAVRSYAKDRDQEFPTERLRREVMHLMNFGYEQRSVDLIETTWNFGVPTTLYYSGGTQRLLWAAQCLIDDIARQLNVEWDGFAAFGIHGEDFLRSHLGIVSLPIRTLLNPGDWWGVFHETAHEVIHQSPAAFEALASGVIALQKGGELREGRRALAAHRVSELVADAIAFRRCFFAEWDVYQDCFVEYTVDFLIQPQVKAALLVNRGLNPGWALGEVLPRQMAKLLGVYALAKDAALADLDEIAKQFCETVVPQVIDRTDRALGDYGQKSRDAIRTALEQTMSQEAILGRFAMYGYQHVLFDSNLRQVLDQLTGQVPSPHDIERGKEVVEVLKRGEIITGPIPLPQLAILAIRSKDPVSFQWKMALILSLWNAFGVRVMEKRSRIAKELADPLGTADVVDNGKSAS